MIFFMPFLLSLCFWDAPPPHQTFMCHLTTHTVVLTHFC